MTDVWIFESPEQMEAADDLNFIISRALDNNRPAQNFLKKIWVRETWSAIKEKLETKGSTWYVWFMDGVNAYVRHMRDMS